VAEQLTAIGDWAEAVFAANVVFEPLVGELFRSGLVQQASPRNGDFVTPTVVGAGEHDYAERDLRYTIAMFEPLVSDKEFADHNTALMDQWLSTWTGRCLTAARELQPIWSLPDSKPPRFEDGLDRAKGRFSGILRDLGLNDPKELTQ
jgi:propane monooxygenase small subunit